MSKTRSITIILMLFLISFLIVFQRRLVIGAKTATNRDEAMRLAYEVIDMANNNLNLQKEADQLEKKNTNSILNAQNQANFREDTTRKITEYKVANGLDPISGRGVEITIDGNMMTEEAVDLVNGIRNIKPKAVGINDNRVVFSSYFVIDKGRLEFDNKIISIPFNVQIIGDPDSITKSLDRPGGILDVLKKNSFGKLNFELKTKDNMTLPAYGGKINFRFVKPTI